jgi:hypothetical protein
MDNMLKILIGVGLCIVPVFTPHARARVRDIPKTMHNPTPKEQQAEIKVYMWKEPYTQGEKNNPDPTGRASGDLCNYLHIVFMQKIALHPVSYNSSPITQAPQRFHNIA